MFLCACMCSYAWVCLVIMLVLLCVLVVLLLLSLLSNHDSHVITHSNYSFYRSAAVASDAAPCSEIGKYVCLPLSACSFAIGHRII